MTLALLGLGGNVGDPVASMRQALQSLDADGNVTVVAVSRLFRTPPWGKTDQPWFVNACAAIETGLAPEPLLDLCLAIERGLKRVRAERWGPRTIDIDVLALGDQAHASERLTLPHPRVGERAFVLAPLADIAPAHLFDGQTVRERLSKLDRHGIEPIGADCDWWRAER